MTDGAFRALLAAVAGAVGGFSLLLPVVPVVIASRGGGPVAVGAGTAVFMLATVLTQVAVPRVLRSRGHRWAMLVGSTLLGLPAVVVAVTPGVPAVLLASAVRGVGFGLLTVAGFALVAELVPAASLGRASALMGFAFGGPQLVLLPVGVAVVERVGAAPVLVTGGVLSLLGAVAAAALPRPGEGPLAQLGATAVPEQRAGRWHTAVARTPVAAVLACALCYGATVTFLPPAVPGRPLLVAVALAVLAGVMLVARWVAGVVGDRRGRPGSLLLPGTAAVAAGAAALAGAAAAVPGEAVLALLGAAALGAGFGAVQTDALVVLFARAGAHHRATASAAFNVAFDAGTGVGAAVLGAVVGRAGHAGGFGVVAVLVAAVPVAVLVSSRGRAGTG